MPGNHLHMLRRLRTGLNGRKLIVGIESSCDDTSVCVIDECKNVLFEYSKSQKLLHQTFGGVVPQLAAQGHKLAFRQISSDPNFLRYFRTNSIKCIAVTTGPGIGACLNAGYEFASLMSQLYKIPMMPINHLVHVI